jgi:ATP-dependent exoDNAse (exonuclease V) alpha subunit
MTDIKELIIQKLEETPEVMLDQMLSFLRFLKAQQPQNDLEEQQDPKEARAALAEVILNLENAATPSWRFVASRLAQKLRSSISMRC